MLGFPNPDYDYIVVGTTPVDEECASVGDIDYYDRVRVEYRAYKDQLKRMFPQLESSDFGMTLMGFDHDFGRYHELALWYNTNVHHVEEMAFEIETNLPEKWDEIAIEYLTKNNYFEKNGNIRTTQKVHNTLGDKPPTSKRL